ncbi:hypothetical protein SAMN05216516_102219 [Izhakiella capsodis]|uniref:Uncharacterized protein n=1 Tax=Izhakiella capsodis TaxID=1367852 RepID=A0A1I4W1P7_9GAMM|nr:hypothetical protein SAMN05216516_102219 [Izhakiella capsodis]
MLPNEVTSRELILWRRDQLGEGITTSTWNNQVRHSGAIYNQGIKKKWLILNENPLNETQYHREVNLRKPSAGIG